MKHLPISLPNISQLTGPPLAAQKESGSLRPTIDPLDMLGYWEAYDEDAGSIPNKGTAGSALDATNTGLVKVDGGAVWFPGTNGNYISTNNVEVPAGDINAYVRCVRPIGTAVVQSAVSKWLSAGNEKCWSFGFNTTSKPHSYISTDGVTTQELSATTEPGIAIGDIGWWRFWVDTTLGEITWYWAEDSDTIPSTWNLIENRSYTGTTLFASGASHTLGSTQSTGGQFLTGVELYAKVEYSGTTVFEFNAEDDVPANPAATEFNSTSGHAITVNRGSGPVTTLVPSGKSVLINPDETVNANKVTITDDPAFDALGTEDFFLWVAHYGMDEAYRSASRLGQVVSTSSPWNGVSFRYNTRDIAGGDTLGAGTVGIGDTANGPYVTPNEPTVAFIVHNRSDATLTIYAFNANDEIAGSKVHDATTQSGLTLEPLNGASFMDEIASSYISSGWNVGVGIAPTVPQMKELATWLLTQKEGVAPQFTSSKYPPNSPSVGDMWAGSNGQTAYFAADYTWQPYSPPDATNVPVMLANNDLWIGVE